MFNFPIIMNAVESSNITNIGYNAVHKVLRVDFKNSKTYCYQDVPADTWKKFWSAPSKGAFLAQHIKGKFPFFELDVISNKIVDNTPCDKQNNC